MNKLTKRVVAFCSALVISFSLVITASAEETEKTFSQMVLESQDDVEAYALASAKEFKGITNLQVKNSYPLIDNNNQTVGYSVSFEANGKPYGYMNLNFTYECPLIIVILHFQHNEQFRSK